MRVWDECKTIDKLIEKKNVFVWSEETGKVFEALKEAMITILV